MAVSQDLRQDHFIYASLANRVIFGNGRISDVKQEAVELGGTRALVLATKYQVELAERISKLLGELSVGIHAKAVQHVPNEVVETAVEEVKRLKVDLLIAPGGGSTIGLAKGIALETGLPILAIPTTYAGSEMTHIWGISKDGKKTTGRDPIVKPRTVIYDPELITTLPTKMSLTSGINAMAHAVEALYAQNRNPISSMMAEEGIRQLAHSLPTVVAKPDDINGRYSSLYGAWLCATVLDTVGMALHHKLCHTLGGSFGMPHAETHTVILPYAIAYNHQDAPEAMQAIARALNCNLDEVAGVMFDISKDNGGPTSLQELGFREQDLDQAANIATQNPYYNPRPVVEKDILELLKQAYSGTRPG